MKAQPDGYTLLVEGNSFWFAPLMQKTPYEVLRHFSPVTQALTAPNILVTHPSVAGNASVRGREFGHRVDRFGQG
jgi:tripartite-type tricarboxylate transporter receptor subunit TctC